MLNRQKKQWRKRKNWTVPQCYDIGKGTDPGIAYKWENGREA